LLAARRLKQVTLVLIGLIPPAKAVFDKPDHPTAAQRLIMHVM
jgi:hypothetical protein